uniref:Uncharacterized protein n=1 Tax=Salmonella sp. TaxID=599 RepID=A0A6M4NKS4_SALSP|nr:hypothetical protein [Salmonella sp.]
MQQAALQSLMLQGSRKNRRQKRYIQCRCNSAWNRVLAKTGHISAHSARSFAESDAASRPVMKPD